jgi:hypothetical protein
LTDAFLAGSLTQAALWLVLVTKPPAKRDPAIRAAKTVVSSFLIGFILNLG